MIAKDAWGADARIAHLAAAPARAAQSSRQHVDALFAPVLPTLNDEQRAMALSAFSELLRTLVADLVENAGRLHIDPDEVAAELELSPHLRLPQLASALIHRAEEARLSRRLRMSAFDGGSAADPDVDGGAGILAACLESEDESLAAAAIAYEETRNARRDREGTPSLLPEELPPGLASSLCWTAAAMIARHDEFDRLSLWARTARKLNARRDLSMSAQHRAMRLSARLQERGEIDGRLLQRLILEGDPLLLVAAVAAVSGISSGTAWNLAFRVDTDATLALLLAMRLPAAQVTAIAERLFAATGRKPPENSIAAAAVELEDALSSVGRDRLLAYWQVDPSLRAVLDVSGTE